MNDAEIAKFIEVAVRESISEYTHQPVDKLTDDADPRLLSLDCRYAVNRTLMYKIVEQLGINTFWLPFTNGGLCTVGQIIEEAKAETYKILRLSQAAPEIP